MPIGKSVDKILNSPTFGTHTDKVHEITIEEGMMLSVNKMISDAIKIPEGDYMIWAINANTCQLMPTSESVFDVIEISKPTLKGFYNSEIHRKIINKSKDAINENLMLESSDGKIYNLVKQQLEKEGGHLKSLLVSGELTLDEIINSIKRERCIRSADRDLGSTYLSQMVGTAIREIIPTNHINQARVLFGLSKLSPKELKGDEYTGLDKKRTERAKRR